MEWGETVESMATAVVNNRIQPDSADIRHTGEFLAYRILVSLSNEMKKEKEVRKMSYLFTNKTTSKPRSKRLLAFKGRQCMFFFSFLATPVYGPCFHLPFATYFRGKANAFIHFPNWIFVTSYEHGLPTKTELV